MSSDDLGQLREVVPGVYVDDGGNFTVDPEQLIQVGAVTEAQLKADIRQIQDDMQAALRRGDTKLFQTLSDKMMRKADKLKKLDDDDDDDDRPRRTVGGKLPSTKQTASADGFNNDAPYAYTGSCTVSGAGSASTGQIKPQKETTLRYLVATTNDAAARITSINIDGDEYVNGSGGVNFSNYAPGLTNPCVFDRKIGPNNTVSFTVLFATSGTNVAYFELHATDPFGCS